MRQQKMTRAWTDKKHTYNKHRSVVGHRSCATPPFWATGGWSNIRMQCLTCAHSGLHFFIKSVAQNTNKVLVSKRNGKSFPESKSEMFSVSLVSVCVPRKVKFAENLFMFEKLSQLVLETTYKTRHKLANSLRVHVEPFVPVRRPPVVVDKHLFGVVFFAHFANWRRVPLVYKKNTYFQQK